MPAYRVIFGKLCIALACACVGAAAMKWGTPAFIAARGSWMAPASTRPTTRAATQPSDLAVDTWVVKKGDLRITFVESGKLRAIKSYPIFPTIAGQQLKIAFLATEGATVKKDELLVSFDKKAFEDQLQTTNAELEGALRQLTVNQSALEIAKSTGVTGIALAATKLDEAQVALKTYVELEGPKKLNELEGLINEARGKAAIFLKTVADAQAKIDDGLFSEEDQKKQLEAELSDAQQSYHTLQKSTEALTLQRKIFRAYEYPQTLKSRKQAVDGAKMEVSKAKVSADNEVNQKQAEVERVNDTISRTRRQVAQLQEYLTNCDIRAPVAGLVVYGDTSSPYIRYDGAIKVGAEWYGGQTLMTIPDLSAFEIDINVAENYVGKVSAGMPVNVTFEAVPNLKINGRLKEIAKLGQPRERYDPGSPRVFTTIVSLENSDTRLVSGMTGRVEIVADQVAGAFVVPMDAVSTDQGQTIVMIRLPNGKTERREVKVGRSNNSLVEITEGLVEGERVALGVMGLETPK